ncbi:MAG: hypothetical protein JKY53_00585 [Flavobacteriales bacterium]|nr:hypothetical protein [Flavobacteriales bacterium]
MKRYSIIVILLLFGTSLKAQDIIVKKTGEKIEVKVVKIEKEQVEYRNIDDTDGPIYVISTVKISKIILENGTIEEFAEQSSVQGGSTADNSIPAGSTKYAHLDSMGKSSILIRDMKYYQVGRKIGMNYIFKNVDKTGNSSLQVQKKKVQEHNTVRYAFLILTPVAIVGGVVTSIAFELSFRQRGSSTTPLMVGGVIAGLSFLNYRLVTMAYKRELNNHC